MDKAAKIYVAGHRGMVGSAIVRALQARGYHNLVMRSSKELDLRNQSAVNDFFNKEKPSYVFLAAAKVGGILANNTYRASFIYDNLAIELNVIHAAHVHNVKNCCSWAAVVFTQNGSPAFTRNLLAYGCFRTHQ